MTPGFHRNTWIEINHTAIYENIKNEKEILPAHVDIWAVVKANAYGHGIIEVAKTAKKAGVTGFCVAILDEALTLRRAGFVEEAILVLGATRLKDVDIAAKENISVTAFDMDWIKEVNPSEELKIHLKIDSGMGRLGLRTEEEITEAVALICANPKIEFEGIFTHFATADQKDTAYYSQQIKNFESILAKMEQLPRFIHAANSAAALFHDQSAFNLIRYGIAMYGLSPSTELKSMLPYKLKPALSLYTEIIQIKEVPPENYISYGATYKTNETEWIATLPIGYADGFIRAYAGFEVIVEGVKAPIIGRVCMDQAIIRLPKYYPPGTKVTIIGENNGAKVTADDCAFHLGTINYEVTCLLSNRIPRYNF